MSFYGYEIARQVCVKVGHRSTFRLLYLLLFSFNRKQEDMQTTLPNDNNKVTLFNR